jgi:hypothetical protein
MHLVGTIDTNYRGFSWDIEVGLSPNPPASFGFSAQGLFGLSESLQVAINAICNWQCFGKEVLHESVWEIGKGFHSVTF